MMAEITKKYGPDNFSIHLLEEVEIEDRYIAEQRWIDDLNPEFNVNNPYVPELACHELHEIRI